MKQKVIWDFLNLPGIAEVALIDGHSSKLWGASCCKASRCNLHPLFCDVNQVINSQQKQALSKGILRVVETVPDGFESFQLKFSEYQVYIYKLQQNRILLVLTDRNLVASDYSTAIVRVRVEVEADFNRTIDLLKAITARQNQSKATEVNEAAQASRESQPLTKLPTSGQSTATIDELLAAFNHLSQFTTQYLGIAVIVNYLKVTRPQIEWFAQFQIDRAACISFLGFSSEQVSVEEHQWIRDWVAAFIRRCSQVVRDFATVVEQKALDAQQKLLLLS